MVILRPTKKLHSLLRPTDITPHVSDTALGDWYVNRVVVARQPLLLLVSSTSLLSILLPARDVRCLPDRLEVVVEARLKRCGVSDLVIAAEKRAMTPIAICPTIDRSVLGIMVDFAKSVPYVIEAGPWSEGDLCRAEDLLAKTPCHAARSSERVIFPDRKAPELLSSKWLAN